MHKRFLKIPYQVLVGLFLIAAVVSILALRHNNTTMIGLRNNLYAADQNNDDVAGALNKLRVYVYGHMNTDLASGGNAIKPPIQLKYTYDRLVAQAEQAANNAGLYTAAENYCQGKIPASVSISGRGRISCVTDYVLSHGGRAPAPIPAALYEFDFASPRWSPDLAGWSLVVTFILFILAVVSLALQKLVRAIN